MSLASNADALRPMDIVAWRAHNAIAAAPSRGTYFATMAFSTFWAVFLAIHKIAFWNVFTESC